MGRRIAVVIEVAAMAAGVLAVMLMLVKNLKGFI